MTLESTLELRYMGPNQGCRLAGVPEFTFKIDIAAIEQITAVEHDGSILHVWWAEGFVGRERSGEFVVVDPADQIVARDGERLLRSGGGTPTLHGYKVCAGGQSVYIFLSRG